MTSMDSGDILRRMSEAAADGLTLVAARVQGVAVPRTPMEYGDLRSSLVVTPATPEELTSAVSSDLPYAVRQHEELAYRHHVGQAKFLESAALDSRDDAQKIMATAARKAFQ